MIEAKTFSSRFVNVEELSEGSMAKIQTAIDAETDGGVVIKTALSLSSNPNILKEAEVTRKLRGCVGFPELVFADRTTTGRARIVVSRARGSKFDDARLSNWSEQEEGLGQLQLRLQMMHSYADRIKTAWSKGILPTDYKSDAFILNVSDQRAGVIVIDLNITRDIPNSPNVKERVDAVLQRILKPTQDNGTFKVVINEASHILSWEKDMAIQVETQPGSREYKILLKELENFDKLEGEKQPTSELQIRNMILAYYSALRKDVDERAEKAMKVDFFEFVGGIIAPIFSAKNQISDGRSYQKFDYEKLLDKLPDKLQNLRSWVIGRLRPATKDQIKSDELLDSFRKALEKDISALGGDPNYFKN